MLDKVERCGVEPLQVIEKQYKRVLGLCEHSECPAKDHLEPIMRILRGQFRRWRLLPDNDFHFGDKVDDEFAIRPKRFDQCIAPSTYFHIALRQNLPHEFLQRLSQRGVWNIALVLVKFAGRKSPRGGTIALCSSLTTEDFPAPEYPETNTSSV